MLSLHFIAGTFIFLRVCIREIFHIKDLEEYFLFVPREREKEGGREGEREREEKREKYVNVLFRKYRAAIAPDINIFRERIFHENICPMQFLR